LRLPELHHLAGGQTVKKRNMCIKKETGKGCKAGG